MRGLVAWVSIVTERPILTLLVVGVLTLGVALYAADNIRLNSDNARLVRQDAQFRQDYKELLESFPHFRDTTLVVLSGESRDVIIDAHRLLADALSEQAELISHLYAPGADPFFEDHAFLYLEADELEAVVARLARSQPALAALAADPSLRGLFDELELGVENVKTGGEPPLGMIRMSNRLSDIGEGMLAGRPLALSWSEEFFGTEDTVYRLIVVQGRERFDQPTPAEELITEIRTTAETLLLTPENGVTVRLTGRIPLAHEELVTMRSGLVVAGTLSAVLLTLILGYGLRSLRIVVATVITLVFSLVWTTAYAMATVGEFNTISAAFAVLLLGLGVDFGIHFGLRYEEEACRGLPVPEALTGAAAGTGGAISLCALTSAIGFASFIPTWFTGLAELGAIAAGGMLFSLIASYTVFPALLALRGPPSHPPLDTSESPSRWQDLIERYATLIVTTACCIGIASTILAYRYMTFDFSTLALKDANGEGMTTLRELQAQEMVTDYALTMLAPDRAAAEELADQLSALDEVAEARTPAYFVPTEQDDKLSMLEDAQFMLETALAPGDTAVPPTDEERLASIEDLLAAVEALPNDVADAELRESLRRLGAVLNRVLTAPDPNAPAREFERLIVEALPERIEWLRRALSVDAIGFDDLPASLRERVIDIHGRYSVVAMPTGDMSDAQQLGAFVNAVASVRPHATGRPSLEVGIGEIIVQSFRVAIALAFISVLIILRLSLHDFVEALIVIMPITLAALITIAVGVLFDLPFTIANVVAIPLILGLGVDSAIHVYVRYRDDGTLEQMMASSTPRAVMLSALTTLAAFCSLSLSPHAGFSGLGMLLSISVLALLYCTLIVLPAMIKVRIRWQSKRSAAR
jgi:hypothetical protein